MLLFPPEQPISWTRMNAHHHCTIRALCCHVAEVTAKEFAEVETFFLCDHFNHVLRIMGEVEGCPYMQEVTFIPEAEFQSAT